MDIDQEMRRWSQTLYGLVHALHVARSVKLGNLGTLIESLSDAEDWEASDPGFESCVPTLRFKEDSIRLDGRDHEEIFASLSTNLLRALFINLAVLADEWVGECIRGLGTEPPNFLTGKAEWVKKRIASPQTWAACGLLEMCAIRNALVHNNGVLNQSCIDILRLAGTESARPGHEIRISVGDLFRYRRALRTVVGELRKMGRS